MASSRKKQDEIHLKILRNLVSLPGNKQCFDCNQKGPTYVNVTIGSFVCTTCSGLLRGLTPPHRVKSISMATFTSEEIESLQSKGNEHCKKVWLALYDSNNIQNTKDEHLVRDFMVAKYEKKLYYAESSIKNENPKLSGQSVTGSNGDKFKIQPAISKSSPAASPPINLKVYQNPANSCASNAISANTSDLFKVVPNQVFSQKNQNQEQLNQFQSREISFANFENNPIFNSSNITSSTTFPSLKPSATIEDKYAALKDLDCLMKMQQGSPQNQGSVGNGWSSNNLDKGSTLNPFQNYIGNNNVINPFRSGLIQQADKNVNNYNNNNIGSCGYDGSESNNSNYSNPSNPWGSSNAWISNSLSVNQLAFPAANWGIKGDISVVPGNSNNPFL